MVTSCIGTDIIKHVTEEKTKGTSRKGRRRKDLEEKRIHWNVKQEALDHNLWSWHFGRGFVRVANRDYVMDGWMDGRMDE